jgi:hypothetical protein
MSDTPRTDNAILTDPYQVRELGFEVVRADDMEELERELNEAKKDADALADAIEYTLKADSILHPATDHVGMRQTLEIYRSKYKEGKQ